MTDNNPKLTHWLRRSRIWHRYLGLGLSLLLFISAITGILLAWKKNVDTLQPPTTKGTSTELAAWEPLEGLATLASKALLDSIGKEIEIDRMDVRPSKGIVKVLFKKGNWEVQVDGTSGQILSIAKRHSDWIEKLHDGSIISDTFKLFSMNILGFGLLLLMAAGLWLWYGPKVLRNRKRRKT